MFKYVIMGIQGCGKGTQAKMLSKDFNLVHMSVGDIFRWHIQSHTKLAARIARSTAAGELVSDDIVEEIVRDRLDQHDDPRQNNNDRSTGSSGRRTSAD